MQLTADFNQHRVIGGKLMPEKYKLFLALWFVINLVQISFTELTSDEGYYWFYATKLQWGYYDHPPMVALLIYLGKSILPGELGVRIGNLLLLTIAVGLFLNLLPHQIKNSWKTFVLLLSATLLNYLTFIVFPDGPLLFFSLLFLVVYKRFLKCEDLANAILLGVAIALMLYSKYHGVLIVLFTVLANLKLLKSKWFWLAALISTLLFFPHLWWQYQNDFPTLKYHLTGRTTDFSFRFVHQFLSQQIFALSPALIVPLFFVRTKGVFEKTLYYIIIGSLIFFLFTSFKTFIHFHWTSIAVFPLLYFAVHFYDDDKRNKLFKWLVIPFVIILFAARFILLFDVGINRSGVDYYHGRKEWADEIKQVAAGRPAFFPNNLREASLYSFYAGANGVTLYNRPEKKSQYEMWGYEEFMQGRPVLMVTTYPVPGSNAFLTKMKQQVYFTSINNFTSFYNNILINAELIKLTADSVFIHLKIKNERPDTVLFGKSNEVSLLYHVQNEKEIVSSHVIKPLTSNDDLVAGSEKSFDIVIPRKDLPNASKIIFGFRHSVLPESFNSNAVEIK